VRLSLFAYSLFMLEALVFSVVTGYYLFGVETYSEREERGILCFAPSGENDTDITDNVNVDKDFHRVLVIMFTVYVVDVVRGICLLLGIFVYEGFGKIVHLLLLNDCLGLASLILLMVFRLRYEGKWCSGDYNEERYGEVY